jgi:hypothetical protein
VQHKTLNFWKSFQFFCHITVSDERIDEDEDEDVKSSSQPREKESISSG